MRLLLFLLLICTINSVMAGPTTVRYVYSLTLSGLTEEINEYLASGWLLVGGAIEHKFGYLQTIVLEPIVNISL